MRVVLGKRYALIVVPICPSMHTLGSSNPPARFVPLPLFLYLFNFYLLVKTERVGGQGGSVQRDHTDLKKKKKKVREKRVA